jgi:hypothetical protein
MFARKCHQVVSLRGSLLIRQFSKSQKCNQYVPQGLLTADSLNDMSQFYSTNLDIATSYKLVSTKKVFENALKEDGCHDLNFKFDSDKMNDYLRTKDICGRMDTLTSLHGACAPGKMSIVSGGFSVGKSKIMNHLATATTDLSSDSQSPGYSLVVDGRMSTRLTLDDAIVHTISHYLLKDVPKSEIKHLNSGLSGVVKTIVELKGNKTTRT